MPKLSIITINLNNVEGLRKTIESVISQTSTDFEYIIIDGGSTDGSLEVIKSFTNIPPGKYYTQHLTSKIQHCPISYWLSEPDSGIYNAMNKGIELARGEFCQFLNSGDILVSDCVTSYMLQDLDYKYGFIYGGTEKYLGTKRLNTKLAINMDITNPSFMVFYLGSLNHGSVYIKSHLFQQYGLYDESFKIVSDWKFYIETIIFGNESICKKNKIICRFDITGISNTNGELNKLEREQVLKELIPERILIDYKKYSSDIKIIQTLKQNKFVWNLIYVIYRLINKIDRIGWHFKNKFFEEL